MAFTTLLKIPTIGAGQANAYITANDAIQYLEHAHNRRLNSGALGGSDWTVSEANFIRYGAFVAESASGAFDITMPATVNGTTTERIYSVRNATAQTATLQSSGTPAATVTLRSGASALVYQNGTTIVALAFWNGATTAPYNPAFFKPGQPTASEVCLEYRSPTAFDMADDFAGSYGYCIANPTSTATFDVKKNGSNIGTVAISTLGVFTFLTSGGATSMAAGDRLSVVAPGSPDATLSGIAISFAGTRTL